MIEYCAPQVIDKYDVKRLRNKLEMTQEVFANFIGVSKKTVERWETQDKEISGPITRLYFLLNRYLGLVEEMKVADRVYGLRLKYYYGNLLCSVIDVDERQREVKVWNYQKDFILKAFGSVENPTFEDYEDFLASRCVPRERDKIKLVLRELDVPFYDPLLIIEKTQGRMVEDDFWLKIERDV